MELLRRNPEPEPYPMPEPETGGDLPLPTVED